MTHLPSPNGSRNPLTHRPTVGLGGLFDKAGEGKGISAGWRGGGGGEGGILPKTGEN